MTRAAIYARISDDSEGKAVGVTNQQDIARELADAHGLSVSPEHIYVDNDRGASTKSRKTRPEFDRMLADAETGAFSTIVAYSMSRLTRRPMEWETLIQLSQRRGIDYLYKVSPRYDLNTADGRATARTVAAWDAAEAERTSERVTANQAAKRAKGEDPGGSRPFGFTSDRKDVLESEARYVREAYRRVLEDEESVYSVAKWLSESGAQTTGGASQWSARATREMLLRSRNAGILETLTTAQRDENAKRKKEGKELIKPTVYSTDGPRIVTPDQLAEMRSKLSDPNRAPKRGPRPQHLLSNLAKCGVCGYSLAHTTSVKGKGRSYLIYRCTNNMPVGRGTHPTMRDELLEDAVITEVLKQIGEGVSAPTSDVAARIRGINTRLAEIAAEASQVTQLGMFPGADLKAIGAKLTELENERLSAQTELDGILSDRASGGAFEAFREYVRGAGSDLGSWSYLIERNKAWEAWTALELDAQRAILGAFEIALHPAKAEVRVTVKRR